MLLVMGVAIAALIGGRGAGGLGASVLPLAFIGLIVFPVSLWASFALQARRIRDIGWNPAYVIPAWLVIVTVDIILAGPTTLPGGLSVYHGTFVGSLANLALSGCLLFWPGNGGQDDAPAPKIDRSPKRAPPPPSVPAWMTPATPPPAQSNWSAAPARPTGFGRRGL
jgi:uncharacterized membrane protein YhaH (DUF805 family)